MTKSDEQLMSAIKERDEGALASLRERHGALLRTIIGRIVNDEAEVEEILLNAFSEIWRHPEHYCEEKGKALGWIVTFVRRRAIDTMRSKAASMRAEQRRADTALEPKLEAKSAESEAGEKDADAERAATLARVINSLPEAQREAITYAFYRGMSQREIAALTGIPLGTIKSRLEIAQGS